MRPFACRLIAFVTFVLAPLTSATAQEPAYFVTYDHYLEEPGNLEVAVATTTGIPKNGASGYTAPWLELEYGVKGWWTAELYLEGVTSARDGSGFGGWRFENRFRPWKTEHAINPVLYVEFEDVTEASRIQKEIVGTGGIEFESIADLRQEHERELETKLIISSAVRGWNVAENVVFEKNLSADEGIEFGYAIGISRPLSSIATGSECRFCRENLTVGVEVYGGLGSTDGFGTRDTRHYVAPVIAWQVSPAATVKFSTGFGLTNASDHALVRIAYAYEFSARRPH